MEKIKNAHTPVNSAINSENTFYEPGITKREYFAGLAMQGLCASVSSGQESRYIVNDGYLFTPQIAKDAISMADELLIQLEQ